MTDDSDPKHHSHAAPIKSLRTSLPGELRLASHAYAHSPGCHTLQHRIMMVMIVVIVTIIQAALELSYKQKAAIALLHQKFLLGRQQAQQEQHRLYQALHQVSYTAWM